MDVVEFAERVLDLELFDYQKEILRKVYTEVVSGQTVYIAPPRHFELGYLCQSYENTNWSILSI